jgi:membrane-associated protease RseP (regulator of RpoE activity)
VTLGEKQKIHKKLHRKLGKLKEHSLERQRGFLGVHTQGLSGELGEYFGIEGGAGALVTEVVEDSPAAKLGLKAGDVIVELDDEKIEDPSDLRRAIREYTEETEVRVVWKRDRKEKSGTTTLELRDTPLAALGHTLWGEHGFLPHLPPLDFDVEIEEDWDELGEELERKDLRRARRLRIRPELEISVEKLSEEIEELRKELEALKEDLAAD